MELLDHVIPIVGSEPVFVHLLTDIHRSALGCDARKLRSDISRIAHAVERGENHWWLGGGDWSNAIGPRDKRFDSSAVAPEFHEHVGKDLFQAEARVLADEFRPIRDRGIGIGMGNHEEKIAKYGEFNPAADVAERLNLPFLGYSALIRLRLEDAARTRSSSVLIYWHHGRGAARTKGSKVTSMYSFRDVVQADIYMSGHTHELMEFPEVVLTGTRRGAFRLVRRDVMFINGGTYLKAYPADQRVQEAGRFDPTHHVHTDYAEVQAFRPSVIGHAGVKITLAHSGGRKNAPQWETRFERVEFR